MEPTRTCVGCRERAENSSLVRVIARNSALDIDLNASAQGRGSWVHPTKKCIETALTRKAFGRALKTIINDTQALTRFLESL